MNEIEEILGEAKTLAKKYRKLTGKPLGITGEVAEVSAAKFSAWSWRRLASPVTTPHDN